MSLPLSDDMHGVLDEAYDIADRLREPLSSAHLLLALCKVRNPATRFLEDRGITATQVADCMTHLAAEPPSLLDRIYARGERIARGSSAPNVAPLHVLAALVRASNSQAVELLRHSGANVSALRASVMSYATGSTPLPSASETAQPTATLSRKHRADATRERAPSPIGFHPSLGIGHDGARRRAHVQTHDPDPSSGPLDRPAFERRATRPAPSPDPSAPSPSSATSGWKTRRPKRLDDKATPAPPPDDAPAPPAPDHTPDTSARAAQPDPKSPLPIGDDAVEDARRTARRLAAKLAQKRQQKLLEDARTPPLEDEVGDGASVIDSTPAQQAEAKRVDAPPNDTPRLEIDLPAARDSIQPDQNLAARYLLDEDAFPNLVQFGRNLTYAAALGDIDRVIGRRDEIVQLIDIVGKRRSNNPVLVGEAGVGKTAIVEGLAREFVKLAHDGNRLGERTIVELELGRLLSGTHLRGSFAERLIGIKDEVEQAEGQIIVFLDELHVWMNAGGGGDGTDAAGELKTALARGRFPCIGATTHDEFQRFVESDPAFERRFQLVFVDEPDIKTAISISTGVSGHYAKHHDVLYQHDAIESAVRLSHRYLYQRRLPDKAIGVLDLAGSRAARTGVSRVDRDLVATIVAESAGIPVDRLTQSDRKRFLQMESYLGDGLVGHAHVVESVSDVIRRNYAGFRGNRPIGSLLFLGPTGVGKTELVKVLADFLFHDRDAIVRLDMSEFMEAHSVSRMLGAPPGYVGHEQGGQLTEAVRRRPYQVVLLDEIEKAHPDLLNILLQLFDEGQLTDGRSRPVSFSNTLVVMTSNLGAEVFDKQTQPSQRSRIGFGQKWRDPEADQRALIDQVKHAARQSFTPELWNRIDEKLCFLPLSRDEVAAIAKLQLEDSRVRLHAESGIDLCFGEQIVNFLVDHGGYDRKLGARPMRQTIQRYVEGAVARLILSGGVDRGDTVRVEVQGAELVCVPA